LGRHPWELLFVAMAHQRLKKTRQAEQFLAQALAWIEVADRAWTEQWERPGPRYWSWWERAGVQALRRKAQAVGRRAQAWLRLGATGPTSREVSRTSPERKRGKRGPAVRPAVFLQSGRQGGGGRLVSGGFPARPPTGRPPSAGGG